MAKAKPQPMRYYGGKGRGKADWILKHLPLPQKRQVYIEPFGGMAGVMMRRDKVRTEVYNDIDGNVVNWWLAIRDQPDEFGWLVENTPLSEELFEQACADVQDANTPPLRRALAFHISVWMSMHSGTKSSKGNFLVEYDFHVPRKHRWDRDRVARLGGRMRDVYILRRPAVKLLQRVSDIDHAVIYCDPPYPTSSVSPYRYGDIDKDELTAALLAQRGFCAISGYGDEWEHLGWRREERKALRININGKTEPRVEVLWLNRESAQRRLF